MSDPTPVPADFSKMNDRTSWGNVKTFIAMVEAADENKDAEMFVRDILARGISATENPMPVSTLQEIARVVYKIRLAELRAQEGN